MPDVVGTRVVRQVPDVHYGPFAHDRTLIVQAVLSAAPEHGHA